MPKPEKIRVLECIRQGQIGGGESHLLSLVENLDRNQFHPVVLSFTDGPMIERLQAMNVETQVIHTTRPFDFTKWKTVKTFIEKNRIDLIHAHGTRASSNILWAAKSLGIPVIYTVHGWSFHQDQKPLVRQLRIMGEKYLTSRSSVNISVSKSNQQSGKQYIPAFESIVVNNGIDQVKFNPDQQYPDIRKELSIPADAMLIVFVARFTSHKQPLTLIQAFKEAVAKNPALHLLMVGDGDQKEEAVKKINEWKLNDKITLQSFRQDVPAVLAASDIFVLPSLWEGLPIGLLEAMSMGKAIIASNVDGTSEIIEHNKNGWLVETNDLVRTTAEALVHVSNDPDLRKRYREQARSTITERFNAATMTRQIEQIYKTTLSKHLPN
jgi:glycosyltransferase involved in cell wall biosynthesis